MELLRILDEEAARVAGRALARHPEWPCRRGCDECCRRLARPLELTGAEWARVEEGLAGLSAEARGRVLERARRLAGPPFACPFLEEGACLIYDHRPIACRTYGFYADREAGLYCGQILARVESGEYAEVIWGNQSAVEARLDEAGGRASLVERFAGL